jgi:hypothetical protein
MTYRFLITDETPELVPCTLAPSTASPGKTICYGENGAALVVEPASAGGNIRDARPDENPDSPWTWGDRCGDLLVYRPDPEGEPETIVGFHISEGS